MHWISFVYAFSVNLMAWLLYLGTKVFMPFFIPLMLVLMFLKFYEIWCNFDWILRSTSQGLKLFKLHFCSSLFNFQLGVQGPLGGIKKTSNIFKRKKWQINSNMPKTPKKKRKTYLLKLACLVIVYSKKLNTYSNKLIVLKFDDITHSYIHPFLILQSETDCVCPIS